MTLKKCIFISPLKKVLKFALFFFNVMDLKTAQMLNRNFINLL